MPVSFPKDGPLVVRCASIIATDVCGSVNGIFMRVIHKVGMKI